MKTSLKLQHVNVHELKPRQKEIYNFQKIASVLADYGFNCIKLTDDWESADFLAYHKDGKQTLKVQLKSDMSIHTKYMKKDLYVVFPIDTIWYLILHDELVKIVGKVTNALHSKSWIEKGCFRWPRPSRKLCKKLSTFRLRAISNSFERSTPPTFNGKAP